MRTERSAATATAPAPPPPTPGSAGGGAHSKVDNGPESKIDSDGGGGSNGAVGSARGLKAPPRGEAAARGVERGAEVEAEAEEAEAADVEAAEAEAAVEARRA